MATRDPVQRLDLGGQNLEPADLRIDGLPVAVESLRGREALSTLFAYEATARLDGDAAATLDASGLIGKPASLVLRDPNGGARTVSGIVTEAELEPYDLDHARLAITLRPELYKLSLGSDCRSFQDSDAVAIVRSVLSGGGVKARFEVSLAYPVREYTAQYNESDFAFVSRLLEEEGIYYWFDHADGSTLVVADHSPAAPDLDTEAWRGGAALSHVIRYHDPTGMVSTDDAVHDLGALARLGTTAFAMGSFNFKKPAFKVAAAHGEGALEHYDAPGAGHDDPAVLAARAKRRGEGERARGEMVGGVTRSVRFAPGRAFELTQHPFSRLDGRLVIVSTEVSISGMRDRSGAPRAPIDVHFTALPEALPFRPALSTPHPKHGGLQSGVVVGPPGAEVHPDEHGRIRLQHHWDRGGSRDDRSGRWVRVAQRGTAASMLLPRMGWNVLSVGEEGSADLPVVLSRTFDAEHPPPYALPENKTRVTFRTATTPAGGGSGGGGGRGQ